MSEQRDDIRAFRLKNRYRRPSLLANLRRGAFGNGIPKTTAQKQEDEWGGGRGREHTSHYAKTKAKSQ